MADEIQLTFGLSATKGNLKRLVQQHTLAVDLTGTRATGGVQIIGTSHEAVGVTDLASQGYLYAKSNEPDGGNYVEIGLVVSGTFYPFAKLFPGEEMQVPMSAETIYAKANTASVPLDYVWLER